MAVGKKKRVSKKTKKSWRKNVDVRDVEDFQENQRLEERLGGAFHSKKDEDLFEIDKTAGGTTEVARGERRVYHASNVGVGVKKSMRLRETDTPKCFALLERRSAVPDPVGRRTKVKTLEEKRHPMAVKKLQKRLQSGILTDKEKEAIRNRERHAERKAKEEARKEFNRDVWIVSDDKRDMEGHGYWLSNDTIRHNLHNTGMVRRKIPAQIQQKTSVLPAVEVPHPGASYNPSVRDHKELLSIVGEREAKVVKEEQHIERVTTKMFSKEKRENVERDWINEMSVGLKAESDGSEVEGDYTTVNPPVRNKKKTLQKRRKLREAMELKEKLKIEKLEKKKRSDLHRLPQFEKFIQKKEAKEVKTAEKRTVARAEKVKKTKLLGQIKFMEPELEFSLSDELKGNLRGVEKQGNLLADRYKSLQKRNILAPSMQRKVKERPVKKYDKANSKMGWEPKGY